MDNPICLMAMQGRHELTKINLRLLSKQCEVVVVATKAGLRRIEAKVVVDASGDADVCHFAGFGYELAGELEPIPAAGAARIAVGLYLMAESVQRYIRFARHEPSGTLIGWLAYSVARALGPKTRE